MTNDLIEALDRMDALLDPALDLLAVHGDSATANASRADMKLIREALAGGVERLRSPAEPAKTPQAEGADWFIVVDPGPDGDGAVFAYDADLGREFGHNHIKDAQERDDPRAARWVVRPAYADRAARAQAPTAVEPVDQEQMLVRLDELLTEHEDEARCKQHNGWVRRREPTEVAAEIVSLVKTVAAAPTTKAVADYPTRNGWEKAQAKAYLAICEVLESTEFGTLSRAPSDWQRRDICDALRELLATKAASAPVAGSHEHANAYLAALLRYTGGFYEKAMDHGMKRGETADAVAHVEKAARALHRLAILAVTPAAPADALDAPWSDLKVAFDCEDSDPLWEAHEKKTLSLPKGWKLTETDGGGARVVAIFRVDHAPRIADGIAVRAAIDAAIAAQAQKGSAA